MKVVITTVNYPTDAVKQWAKLFPGDVIVVGDRKTPKDWSCEGCHYVPFVESDDPGVVDNYARKNEGYLHCGASDIFETDDDTFPDERFMPVDGEPIGGESFKFHPEIITGYRVSYHGWFNVWSRYTKEEIWPRGFPVNLVKTPTFHLNEAIKGSSPHCPVQNTLIDFEPDVDAIWRLMNPGKQVIFDQSLPTVLSYGTWCPFNTQSTWWKSNYGLLTYVPAYCQWRSNDILKSFVAQRIIWDRSGAVAFHAPMTYQRRNPHDLVDDLRKESDLYLYAEQLRIELSKPIGARGIAGGMMELYTRLADIGVIKDGEKELARLETFMERWSTGSKGGSGNGY